MALTAPQLEYARREIVAAVFGVTPATVTKSQIDAVSAAITTFIEGATFQSGFASAISGTVLAGQTAAIQSAVFAAVAKARYGGVA